MIVGDVMRQDAAVECLTKAFAEATVVDRRKIPSYGYRAVHVIVRHHGTPVEIQVRTCGAAAKDTRSSCLKQPAKKPCIRRMDATSRTGCDQFTGSTAIVYAVEVPGRGSASGMWGTAPLTAPANGKITVN
jgi:hypothetical protein